MGRHDPRPGRQLPDMALDPETAPRATPEELDRVLPVGKRKGGKGVERIAKGMGRKPTQDLGEVSPPWEVPTPTSLRREAREREAAASACRDDRVTPPGPRADRAPSSGNGQDRGHHSRDPHEAIRDRWQRKGRNPDHYQPNRTARP